MLTLDRAAWKLVDFGSSAPNKIQGKRNWSDVCVLIVANERGLQQYVQSDKLQEAFEQAAQGMGYAPDSNSLKQIKLSRDSTCNLQGLHPPKHYPKAEADMGTEWIDAAQPTCTNFDAVRWCVIKSSTMRYKSEDNI